MPLGKINRSQRCKFVGQIISVKMVWRLLGDTESKSGEMVEL